MYTLQEWLGVMLSSTDTEWLWASTIVVPLLNCRVLWVVEYFHLIDAVLDVEDVLAVGVPVDGQDLVALVPALITLPGQEEGLELGTTFPSQSLGTESLGTEPGESSFHSTYSKWSLLVRIWNVVLSVTVGVLAVRPLV